jgi:hypothetical protein
MKRRIVLALLGQVVDLNELHDDHYALFIQPEQSHAPDNDVAGGFLALSLVPARADAQIDVRENIAPIPWLPARDARRHGLGDRRNGA